MPKQLHISIERVKIAAHLPVNTMIVWKSAGSGGIQCCVTLFLLSYLKFGGGKFCRSESPVSAKKSLRRNCFGKLGKTLIKSVSLSEKMKRAATMKKVEKTKKKKGLKRERKSFMGKIHGAKKKINDDKNFRHHSAACFCSDATVHVRRYTSKSHYRLYIIHPQQMSVGGRRGHL